MSSSSRWTRVFLALALAVRWVTVLAEPYPEKEALLSGSA